VGLRRIGKEMGQAYQFWWWTCWDISVSSRFEYHMFYVLYPFVTYLPTLPRTYKIFVGKPEKKTPLGRSRCRWMDNI
jgi:hypothetical protein